MDSTKCIKEINDIFGFELEEPSPSSIRELTDNLRGKKSTTSSTKKNIAETFNERKHVLENKKMAPPKLVSYSEESKYDKDDEDFQMAVKLSLKDTVVKKSKYDKDAEDFQMAVKLSLKDTVVKNVYMDENEKLKRELEELKREREEEKRKTFDNLRKERERNEKLQQQLEKDREEENKKMLEILRKEQEDREEQRQLEELYKPYRAAMERNRISYMSSATSMHKNMYEIHIARNEVILRELYIPNIPVLFSLTNTGLYCYRIIAQPPNPTAKFYNCIPVYIFTEPLSLKFAKLLHNSVAQRNPSSVNSVSSGIFYRDIESIIRLIPGGSYKNGNWRQLDGFFGMYYNDVTNELSELPPAVEE